MPKYQQTEPFAFLTVANHTGIFLTQQLENVFSQLQNQNEVGAAVA